MRRFLFLFLLCRFVSEAQNLVPNGSFESYVTCPDTFNLLPDAVPWVAKDNNSVEYFNACAAFPYNVPYSGVGFQYAKDGQAYAAFWAYNGVGINYREYLQVQLSNPLSASNAYFLRFYLSNYPTKYAVNSIGAAITTSAIGSTGGSGDLIAATPDVLKFGNPILNDSAGWVEVSGLYYASGGENYLTIGNFFNDAQTDTVAVNYSAYQGAYYYIDDVSLIPIATRQWQYHDTTIYLGDSVLIGPAISGLNIDWYTTANQFIQNAPAIYVKPVVDSSFVAKETFNSILYTDTVHVTVLSKPASLNKYAMDQNRYVLFPNPGTGAFSIYSPEFPEGDLEIRVKDLKDHLIYEGHHKVSKAVTHLDLFAPNGIYALGIFNASTGDYIVKKLVIQK